MAQLRGPGYLTTHGSSFPATAARDRADLHDQRGRRWSAGTRRFDLPLSRCHAPGLADALRGQQRLPRGRLCHPVDGTAGALHRSHRVTRVSRSRARKLDAGTSSSGPVFQFSLRSTAFASSSRRSLILDSPERPRTPRPGPRPIIQDQYATFTLGVRAHSICWRRIRTTA